MESRIKRISKPQVHDRYRTGSARTPSHRSRGTRSSGTPKRQLGRVTQRWAITGALSKTPGLARFTRRLIILPWRSPSTPPSPPQHQPAALNGGVVLLQLVQALGVIDVNAATAVPTPGSNSTRRSPASGTQRLGHARQPAAMRLTQQTHDLLRQLLLARRHAPQTPTGQASEQDSHEHWTEKQIPRHW